MLFKVKPNGRHLPARLNGYGDDNLVDDWGPVHDNGTGLPVPHNGPALHPEDITSHTRPYTMSDILAAPRAAIPHIAHTRALLDACQRRLAEISDPGLLAIWRLPVPVYRAMMAGFAAMAAGAVLMLLFPAQPLHLTLLIALGFAANIIMLAHLAGGWARRLAAGSLKRRLLALLTAFLLLAEAAIVGHVLTLLPAQLNWYPVTALAAVALLATLAAVARHHPNPEVGRLLDDTQAAKQALAAAEADFADTLQQAAQRFEEERAKLETMARMAAHSLYSPMPKDQDFNGVEGETANLDNNIIRID